MKSNRVLIIVLLLGLIAYFVMTSCSEGFTGSTQKEPSVHNLGPHGTEGSSSNPHTPIVIPTPSQSTPTASLPGQVITAQSGGLPGMTTTNSTVVECPDGTVSQNGLCP